MRRVETVGESIVEGVCYSFVPMSRVVKQRSMFVLQKMWILLFLLACSVGCVKRVVPSSIGDSGNPKPDIAVKTPWLKGQTHIHTDRSGDSHTDPTDVVRWYSEHGYNFIVITDHNVVTRPPISSSKMLILSGVELTWNAPTCGPPESPCNLHMNALMVPPPVADMSVSIHPVETESRESIYRAEMDLAGKLGGLAQLNHPNFRYGADASLIAKLGKGGLRLVEFSNASIDCQNEGDSSHPNTESLWNQVLSMNVDVWNIASDDAHHYYDASMLLARGEEAYVGERGWVMVRAPNTPVGIRAALLRGEFYATTGVNIEDIDANADRLTVVSTLATNTTRFIVEPGVVVQTTKGVRASFRFADLPKGARWVRAVVDDGHDHMAWVQPIRVVSEGSAMRVSGPFVH